MATAAVVRAGGGLDLSNILSHLRGLSLTHSFHSLTNAGVKRIRVSSLFHLGNQRLSEVKGQSQEPGVLGVTPEHSVFPAKVPSLSNY